MARGLGDDVQQDVPQRVQMRVAELLVGPPGQRGVGRGRGDDGVREARLRAVQVEDLVGVGVGGHLPGVVDLGEGGDHGRVAREHGAEPEPFDVERQMLDEPQTAPPGRQHGHAQGLGVEPFEDAEDMAALPVQG